MPNAAGASLEAQRLPLQALDKGLRAGMLALLQSHFDGVDPGDFEADLCSKDGALVLRDSAGRLRGFSTYRFDDAVHAGQDLRVAYFGDTLVEKEAWGSPALPTAVIQLLMEEAGRVSPRPLYCLLLCAGYRTYHFLPFFCRDYYPRTGGDPRLAALRDALARERFGPAFNAGTGIVQLQQGAYALRPGISDPPAGPLDPVTGYFLTANPGWKRGDELACLALLDPSNLTPAARRLLRSPR